VQKAHNIFSRVAIISFLITSYLANSIFVLFTLNNLYDFGSFVASGQLANDGLNPYSENSPLVFTVHFTKLEHSGSAPNLNPPISVLIFQALAKYDPYSSIIVWRIIIITLFLVSFYLLQQEYPIGKKAALLRFAWGLSLAGLWHTFQLGQIYTLALLLSVLTWLLLRRNQLIVAGIFLGMLITLKPNFAFWAILLLFAGNWKTFLSAGATAASISTLPIFFHGIEIYLEWIEATRIFTPDLLIFPGNNSLQGLTAHFGSPSTGTVLSIILAAGILAYCNKNKHKMSAINSLGIITSMLISPIAWTGYTLLTLPIFFEKKTWGWAFWLAAIIFTISFYFPSILFQNSFVNFIVFGWLYGWGLLALLAGIVKPSVTRYGGLE